MILVLVVLMLFNNSGEGGVLDLDEGPVCPNQTFSQNSDSCQPSQQWRERAPRPPRSLSTTPTVTKGFWTGRVGYNNTPVVSRRSPSRPSVLPRSGSELYSRARMVEVLHSEDEMMSDRHGEEDHDVVQLPSGARQKVARGRLAGGGESTVR